jgi:hypothetical protein
MVAARGVVILEGVAVAISSGMSFLRRKTSR